MLTTLSLAAFSISKVNSWGYDERGDNTSHWEELYAECGYSRQSPIDLPIDYIYCEEPLELQWTSEPAHYAIRNTGYSLLAMPFKIDHAGGADISGLEVLHHTNDTNIRLKNSFYHTYESGVNKEYCFDSLHFHWGKTNADGSEHTMNGKEYPLEVHLVHYSCDYPAAGEAIRDYATGQSEINYDDENVLAVIGVLFEIGKPNNVLEKMLDDIIIDGIYEKTTGVTDELIQFFYADFDVKELLPESREIVAYLGSLTTPPCFETVRWHVLKETMTVSEEQMAKFRMLLASADINDSMAPNFRPPMPLNGRKIYKCEEDVDDDALWADQEAKDAALAESSVDEDSEKWHESKWGILAIGFICLFAISFTVCMIALFCLCRYTDIFICCSDGGHSTPNFSPKSPKSPKLERGQSNSMDNPHPTVMGMTGNNDYIHKL